MSATTTSDEPPNGVSKSTVAKLKSQESQRKSSVSSKHGDDTKHKKKRRDSVRDDGTEDTQTRSKSTTKVDGKRDDRKHLSAESNGGAEHEQDSVGENGEVKKKHSNNTNHVEKEKGKEKEKDRGRKKSKADLTEPPVFHALRKEDNEELKKLVSGNVDVLAQIDVKGNNSLHFVARKNSAGSLKILLELVPVASLPSLLNAKNRDGNTFLHVAAEHTQAQPFFSTLFEFIVSVAQSVPNPHEGNNNSSTNNSHSSSEANGNESDKENNKDSRQSDRDDGTFRNTPIIDMKKVALVSKVIDVNATNNDQQTPLHIAAKAGSLEAVRHLIEYGAELNISDIHRNTPLHFAAATGVEAIVSLFVKKGAKVIAKNDEQKTPMHLAVEHDNDDACYILTANGADVSIRYQYNTNRRRKQTANEEQEIDEVVSHLNRYGYVENENYSSSHRKSLENLRIPLPTKSGKEKDPKKILEQERRRAEKWSPMIRKWDLWFAKKRSKLKSRLVKGLPDHLRGEAWKLMTSTQPRQQNNANKYKELITLDSEYSEQIDLDINRSARNHIQFRERFGTGQVALFNILKAYSVYDPEVGYCQGMSDLTAFLLMYVPEEDAFWMLVQILHDKKYDLRTGFLPGFPKLHQTIWIFERLLQKEHPKLARHLMKENVMTTFYTTKWFLLVFLDAFSFPVTIRIWDLFLFKGYDIVYTVALGIMRILEKTLLSLPMDQIMAVFKSLEDFDIDPDEFIKEIMKHKVKSKLIRKLEVQYAAEAQPTAAPTTPAAKKTASSA